MTLENSPACQQFCVCFPTPLLRRAERAKEANEAAAPPTLPAVTFLRAVLRPRELSRPHQGPSRPVLSLLLDLRLVRAYNSPRHK